MSTASRASYIKEFTREIYDLVRQHDITWEKYQKVVEKCFDKGYDMGWVENSDSPYDVSLDDGGEIEEEE